MSIEYQMKLNGISICTCVSYEKREICFTTHSRWQPSSQSGSQSIVSIHRNFPYFCSASRRCELISFVCLDVSFIRSSGWKLRADWIYLTIFLICTHIHTRAHTYTHQISIVFFFSEWNAKSNRIISTWQWKWLIILPNAHTNTFIHFSIHTPAPTRAQTWACVYLSHTNLVVMRLKWQT